MQRQLAGLGQNKGLQQSRNKRAGSLRSVDFVPDLLNPNVSEPEHRTVTAHLPNDGAELADRNVTFQPNPIRLGGFN